MWLRPVDNLPVENFSEAAFQMYASAASAFFGGLEKFGMVAPKCPIHKLSLLMVRPQRKKKNSF